MEYLILIHGREGNEPEDWNDAPRMQGFFQAMNEFADALRAEGKLIASRRLQPPEMTTTLRPTPAGGVLVIDGPFVETKESLGGFFLVDCEDLDEALAWAKKLPALELYALEVRPIRGRADPG